MEKIFGVFLIILSLGALFISPVVYQWYFKYFEVQVTEGNELCVRLAMSLFIVGLGASGFYFLDKKDKADD